MGVDIYMSWDGFGIRETSNPNFKKQITGYKDTGKYGYLRIAYSVPYYDIFSQCLCWDWDKKVEFTEELIKEFEKKVKELKGEDLQNKKKQWLDFAKLGKKLNKQNKHPTIYVSY